MTQDKPTKTAMMELIEWAKEFQENYFKPKGGGIHYPLQAHDMVKKATELLEKEKTQIVDAWNKGNSTEQVIDETNYGEKYYEENYGE